MTQSAVVDPERCVLGQSVSDIAPKSLVCASLRLERKQAAFPHLLSGYLCHGHDNGKDHDHSKENSHFEVVAPASVKDAWTLTTAKLAVHEASEQMEAALHTLQEKSDVVAADTKSKLASALNQ